MPDGTEFTITFVCSGNTCRSPMAEGIARFILTKNSIYDIISNSCGTLPTTGNPPAQFAIDICKENGIDISLHTSRQITREIVNNSNLILVMEAHHRDYIARYFPDASCRTYLLTEYKSDIEPFGIPDPIGASREVYETVFLIMKDNVNWVIENLER